MIEAGGEETTSTTSSTSSVQGVPYGSSSNNSGVTFAICSPSDDEEEDLDDEEENYVEDTGSSLKEENSANQELDSNYWKSVTNPLLQFKRISDQGLQNAKDQIRRLSNSGSKLLSRMTLANDCSRPTRGRLRVGHHHHGHLGIPRRGSVQDPMSILKDLNNESGNGNNGTGNSVGFSRKSVSFCQRDNVHVYKSEPYYEDEEDILNLTSLSSSALDDLNDEDELDNKNLVPSFVFPGKKPNYASQFERTLMILESVDISDEDMCLMGNVRVNFANLQMAAAGRKRVTIVAKYSKDDWKTARETKAMIVKAQTHPALSHLMTKAMRFYIDCDDLNVGEVLKFTIHCYAYSQNKQQIPICKDDNDGLSYQVNCTPKLNVWAAKAAQELKNFAPAANRNNCFHKNESNSETVTKNSV